MLTTCPCRLPKSNPEAVSIYSASIMRCFPLKRSIKHGFISSLGHWQEEETKEYRRKPDMLYPHYDTVTGDKSFLKPSPVFPETTGQEHRLHDARRKEPTVTLPFIQHVLAFSHLEVLSQCIIIFPVLCIISFFFFKVVLELSRSASTAQRVTKTCKKCSLPSILPESFKILSTREAGASCEEWGTTASKCCLKWILMRYHTHVLISPSVLKVVRYAPPQPPALGTKLDQSQDCTMDGEEFMALNMLVCLLISIKLIGKKPNKQTTEIFIKTELTKHQNYVLCK